MEVHYRRGFGKLITILLVLFLLAGLFGLLSPVAAMAAGGDITIHGEGLNSTEPITITQAQLRGEELLPDGTTLEQNDVWYSTINTWPTKKWYRGVGVKLTDLLSLAGGLRPEATMIKFSAPEGFSAVFTVQEFVYTPRYCFPNFMDTGLPGYLPGDTSESMQVETIIAHQSVSAQVYEEISDDENFSDGEANLLLFGQRAVTEQTNARFVKNLTQIEVLTDPVAKWDSPLAEPSPGEVPVGTMVRLSGPKNDEDKVHYTLDGSEPTIKSPMYNWIAWRWWDSRQDELDDINTPIEITKDTVIKAKVIGPGKEDSDIATFTYQVPLAAAPVLTADSTDNKIGKDIEITFIDNESWRNAIIEVVINNSTLDQDKYVLEAGKIIIYANAFADTGDYTILIKANGYQDAAVSQTITGGSSGGSGGDPKRPPTLNADTNGNFVEEYIRITFRDDRAWRESIDRIEVDGDSLSSKDYTIGEGYIEITDTVFSAPGTYWITIKATGYDDASIAQKIIDNKDAVLTITGEGVKETKTFTWEELEDMPQQQYVYSVINTWPSKRWYIGEGVKLDDLFAEAGGITRDATLIKFFSRDGYYMTLTVEELLEDTRYCFPNFQDGGVEGHIPGSSSGKKVVKPILALKSAESSDDPDDMNKADSLLLMMGQRAVTEQTGPLFVKYVEKIEVLTDSVPQWDEPQADPDSGTVPSGTLVELSANKMDMDKIHYTIDGSTPDINSPMYNWIASRWWSSREDDLDEINHPIEITDDTVIKAITIGPGKEPSDVVTFTYRVTGAETSQSGTVSTGQDSVVSLGNDASIEIPAGAMTGGSEVEVKIERVDGPPPAPEGLRIAGSVYEFTVDDEKSYTFLKKVTIRLRFNSEDFSEGETPSIYRFDEDLGQWESLGGEVKNDTVSVETDRLSKFAVMAPAKLTAQTLKDIAGHWAEESIKELVDLGAVSGYPDGTFRPNDKITRAEFAAILVKALELEQRNGKVFMDTAGYWAEKVISTAANYGIVSGYDEKVFGVKDPVTREQMAVMIVRAVKLSQSTEEISFKDKESISDWARNGMTIAINNGIINGYPDETLRPQGNATRAEAVSVILKAMKSLKI